MDVTGWSNGTSKQTGAGYGIRISKPDRKMYFNRAWTYIEIHIPGTGIVQATLSKSFWANCCEIRNKRIGEWLMRKNLAPWRKYSPPTVRLVHMGDNRFKLNK